MGVGVFCEPYRAYPSNYKYCVDTALNPTWGLVFGVLDFKEWCNPTPAKGVRVIASETFYLED